MPRVGVALLVAVAVAGCGGDDPPPPDPAQTPSPSLVSGPLCDVLPSGDDPGAPETLVREPADVVLTWIPVITTFEAAVRAADMGGELRDVTILAPTDDAFDAEYSRRRLDELLLSSPRELVEPHLVDGARSVAELREAGSVTTRAGATLSVAPAGAMASIDGRARTLCADYRAAGARIHVVDGVLR